MNVKIDHYGKGKQMMVELSIPHGLIRFRRSELPELIQQLCKVPVAEQLDGSFPVVCYFGNDADRNEFIAAVMEAKPGMKAIKP